MMLLAIIASGLLVRIFPFPLPVPLAQVAVGAALSSIVGFKVALDPNVFFSPVYSAAVFFRRMANTERGVLLGWSSRYTSRMPFGRAALQRSE
jgi:NhaP-type Na+/H+ or K+/H+ antiporter